MTAVLKPKKPPITDEELIEACWVLQNFFNDVPGVSARHAGTASRTVTRYAREYEQRVAARGRALRKRMNAWRAMRQFRFR